MNLNLKLCRPICSVDLRHRFQNKFVGSISSYETSITILHGYVLVLFHRIHCMKFFNAHLQKICHWQTRSTFTWCFASVVSHNSSNMFSLLLLIELHWSRRLVANNIVINDIIRFHLGHLGSDYIQPPPKIKPHLFKTWPSLQSCWEIHYIGQRCR